MSLLLQQMLLLLQMLMLQMLLLLQQQLLLLLVLEKVMLRPLVIISNGRLFYGSTWLYVDLTWAHMLLLLLRWRRRVSLPLDWPPVEYFGRKRPSGSEEES